MGSFVALIVQSSFVYRICVLNEKPWWWLYVIICLVYSFPKSRNDLIIPPVALHFRCIWGVLSRFLRESPLLHIIHMSQLQQSYLSGVFIRGVGLQILEKAKSSRTVWIISLTEFIRRGSSQTRSLTCSLHLRCFIMYVRFDCLYVGLFEADCYMPIPQLRRIWAKDGSGSMCHVQRCVEIDVSIGTQKKNWYSMCARTYPISFLHSKTYAASYLIIFT
ncbi:hypothetical protein F5888DRAFT_225987 [Russula emetica]|nr:hypothetical protein F5888DRAFT_225987 [Russula emetica]